MEEADQVVRQVLRESQECRVRLEHWAHQVQVERQVQRDRLELMENRRILGLETVRRRPEFQR